MKKSTNISTKEYEPQVLYNFLDRRDVEKDNPAKNPLKSDFFGLRKRPSSPLLRPDPNEATAWPCGHECGLFVPFLTTRSRTEPDVNSVSSHNAKLSTLSSISSSRRKLWPMAKLFLQSRAEETTSSGSMSWNCFFRSSRRSARSVQQAVLWRAGRIFKSAMLPPERRESSRREASSSELSVLLVRVLVVKSELLSSPSELLLLALMGSVEMGVDAMSSSSGDSRKLRRVGCTLVLKRRPMKLEAVPRKLDFDIGFRPDSDFVGSGKLILYKPIDGDFPGGSFLRLSQ